MQTQCQLLLNILRLDASILSVLSQQLKCKFRFFPESLAEEVCEEGAANDNESEAKPAASSSDQESGSYMTNSLLHRVPSWQAYITHL